MRTYLIDPKKIRKFTIRKNIKGINVKVPVDVANYILNQKRRYLSEMRRKLILIFL